VQRQIAEVPMVLTLFAVLGFAGLIGPMGVLYAMPMTVILYTLARRYLDNRDAEKVEDPA
jgi:predicted PurR-regulated permease PerM